MSIWSKWWKRHPYRLDTTTPKVVNGVTLYQLVTTKSLLVADPAYNVKIRIPPNRRGGWVPSLDVLEANRFGFPWLDAKSHVANTNVRLRGLLYFVNSQCNGAGYIHAPDNEAGYSFLDCQFEGNNHITWEPPPFKTVERQQEYDDTKEDVQNTEFDFYTLLGGGLHSYQWSSSHIKNVHIQGPVHIAQSQLHHTTVHTHHDVFMVSSSSNHSTIENDTPGVLLLRQCYWNAVHASKGSSSKHLRIEDAQWDHVHFSTQDKKIHTHWFAYAVGDSDLAHVTATHGRISHSWCHNRVPGAALSLPPAYDSLPGPPVYFVPIENQSVEPNAPSQITHFVWYEYETNTPRAVHDALFHKTIEVKDLSTYVEYLRTHADSSLSQLSADTIESWQWLTALGVAPPQGQPWIRKPAPQIDNIDLSVAP